ncbi:aminoglycoside phosphotransferase family protein [Kutzneria kofuensis]|uniref:Aminoglycoside phosphotransferase (APT) family kinase protein n=1 Tax=Kutzneria kofuensis TaxID=103725 RepID=A0A7W9KKJ2_9PSEU|nr:aminoglycoside phosphotransferase family protein [Kutzneria kofuensis]MBB5894225.1 aminoglycoside phosphotransferase (APT) family kinase protein [Kutzneria kofuensis]
MRMHADEIDTSPALVRRLVAAQFPQWADLPIERVESSGTDNAMYRLGEDLAVRLPRIPRTVDYLRREQHWPTVLAPQLPVEVPVPVALGEPGEGFPLPWTVLRWIPGRNPVVGSLDDAEALALDLAEFIQALRKIDPTGGPDQNRGVPLGSPGRDSATREAIAQLHDDIDTTRALSLWERAITLPEWSAGPTWSHGDLSPGNVLIRDGRLSAVIDFGGAGVGDPTVDLVVAWNLLPADARDVFRRALDVDDDTWFRGAAWALSIALIQLPYYRDTNPGLVANSRHVINEVLG